MASRRKSTEDDPKPRRRATTPEARENQLVSLAYDLAEERLRDGTASSMEVVHWLRLKTNKAKLEEEKLRKENILLSARAEALESQKNVEKLYSDALKAMKSYQGEPEWEEDEYEDY